MNIYELGKEKAKIVEGLCNSSSRKVVLKIILKETFFSALFGFGYVMVKMYVGFFCLSNFSDYSRVRIN